MENVADIYPLAPAQEGMLFHTVAEPGSGVYVEQVTSTLHGPLREDALRDAWTRAVDRHPVLRTAFLWDGLDEPLQVVRQTVALPWERLDWRGVGPDEQERRLGDLLREDRARGFDLAQAPLLRLRLIQTDADEHRLVWTFHHLALDGWSTALVLNEVWADYAALAADRPAASAAPRPFRDYIAWLKGRVASGTEAFWRGTLAGFEAATPLAIDRTAGKPGPVDQREATLSADETSRLRDLARRHRVTLSTVVQGAWAILLSRYSGERDVVFGTTVSGRPADLAGVEDMVGMFINTLPLRVEVDPEAGVWDWLRGVQAAALAARQHEHTPLAQIQRWSDVPAGQPLFESLVVFENYPGEGEHAAAEVGLRVEGVDYREQSNYPLALLIVPGDGLRLLAVYDTARFDAPAVDRLLGHLSTLLRAAVEGPEAAPVRDLPLLPAAERVEVLALAPGPDRAPIPEGGVLALIESHVREAPDALAVTTEAAALTYAELWAASGRLAAGLRARGVGAGVPVGVCLARTPDLIVGILGVLRAGGAYVPLDPAYPAERLQLLLADAGASVVVTRRPDLFSEAEAVAPDGPHGDGPVPAPPDLDDLAYVIYTSGSTGRPKGVPVTHRNLAHSTQARLDHYPEAVGRFLLLSSVAFDSSVAGLFWTLASGGALVLPAERQEQDVPALAALAERHGVTHTLCLPSLWRVVLDLARPEALASLRCVILAGEALDPVVAAAHHARLPGAALYNEYGPTEATVWATVHRVEADRLGGRLPIGRPIPGARAYVLDPRGEPAPVGVPGDLHLGGDGVVAGYLGRPEVTAEVFGPDPFAEDPGARLYRTGDRARWNENGTLDFLGRADGQVKVRGHRIELGEVEAALRRHPSVREAAAAIHVPEAAASGRNVARLVGYVVPAEGEAPSAADVRSALATRVPDFMVPSAVVVLDALPRTATGKVDRRALPAPEAASADLPASVPPRTPVEAQLAAIWAEVLGLDAVGVEDDFFEIGGDSIASIQIISRANRAGLGLKPNQFFDHPTIAALATVATTAHAEAAPEAAPAGPVPLTPIQRWFFAQDLPDPDHWNQTVSVDLAPATDVERLVEAVRLVARSHDAFRLRYAPGPDGWSQALADPEADRLGVSHHDLSGLPPASHPEAVEQVWTRSQDALDLTAGPLLHVAAIDRGPEAPARLILTAHHLIVDVVSWQTILGEVEDVYGRLGAGEAVEPIASGAPFSRWAEALEREAHSSETEAERAFWAAQAAHAAPPLPTDADGPNTERSAKTLTVGLDMAETGTLTEATAAYGMKVPELLLAAVTEAITAWSGTDRLRVDLEGHGRIDLGDRLDVAETVGWFTTIYPVVVAPSPGDPRGALIDAKEQVRAVPRQGLGYGLLQSLAADRLGAVPAEILFNYMGRGQAPFAEASPFVGTVDLWGSHGPEGTRAHLVEINARIAEGALETRWTYSTNRHRPETVERLAHDTLAALRRLVAHCLAPEAGAYTPSDFPDVDLGQDDLDALLGDL